MSKAKDTGTGNGRKPIAMTPEHPRWTEFAGRLSRAIRAEGCDAESLRLSEKVLRGMDGSDVAKSLGFFRGSGGFCDCEVTRNMGRR